MESVSVIKLNVGGPAILQPNVTDSFESELKNNERSMEELVQKHMNTQSSK